MTKILSPEITTNSKIFDITEENLKTAKELLFTDKLVAFPTETVYGLGANALSDEAIRAVYTAKGRPLDNPLIVHVDETYDISRLVYDDKPYAKKLREAFLPGPLTIVYRSKNTVSGLVSCGLDTLAIRVPSHAGARRFLKYVGIPVAAPSANISKHTSPVTAEHVYNDFGDTVPMILDGGRCEGGIESTVLDATGDIPVILRKGLITAEMVKNVIGDCEYAGQNSDLNKRSPGTKYRHYCPKTQTVLFDYTELDKVVEAYETCLISGGKPLIMCTEQVKENLGNRQVFSLGSTGKEMAARLYYGLHEAERYDLLIGVKFEITDEMILSVENRFLKAFG